MQMRRMPVGSQAMQTATLGSLTVSRLALGTMLMGDATPTDEAHRMLDRFVDAGGTLVDTADAYGDGRSERVLAPWLARRRDDVVLATKVRFGVSDPGGSGLAGDRIAAACDASLRRLGIDVIDLYQVHAPDPDVPLEETLAALDALVQAGKVREIGCSNFSVEQLREAEAAVPPGGARFVSVQNQYSMLHRDPERNGVLAECERAGLAFLPYFPLASGLLTGKYRQGRPAPEGTRLAGRSSDRFLNDRNLAIVEQLIDFAETRGHTILELAFSWLLTRPAVASVIAGATKPEQIRSNVTAAGWKLTPDDLARIDAILAAQ
jgi:aryl-alcohol dehydrogenase-like predicted oxidoreductase